MGDYAIKQLVADLFVILASGLAAGVVCKRFGVSLMVGYMLAGALIGGGGLGLVDNESNALEGVARTGALLLLFSVGNEFSLHELWSYGRNFLVGGSTQMVLTGVPVAVVAALFGMPWQAALLVGCAAALSSTVLVFKGLTELGQLEAPAGRTAVGILLFQDLALVPLILLVPFLSGQGEPPTAANFAMLALKTAAFIASFIVVRLSLRRWAIKLIAELRSTELVCLFAVVILGGACLAAASLDLPVALGALAAGVAFSGTRLSMQIDSILLPFRETFAAVFFVTLGALLHVGALLEAPLLMAAGFVGMLAVKAAAGTIALRLTGLSWPSAAGMGLGLAQLGEFSFLLLLEGERGEVISKQQYDRTLCIALGTLIMTPMLLRIGSRFIRSDERRPRAGLAANGDGADRVAVIGAGPIGRDVATYLETSGWRVTVVDLSPVNLHPFAQQGFDTVVGDAGDETTLERLEVERMRLAIVCLPNDEITTQVTAAIHAANPKCAVIARCRYLLNMAAARQAGAKEVVSEEAEAARAILESVRRLVDTPSMTGRS